jgi:arylsulfatase A-like enzyme
MNEPNVLLVVMDSVSAERLSCYGYHRRTTPRIDEIASESTVYEHAVANSSWTVPTHGTLFTGQYPSEHGAHAEHKHFSVDPEHTLAGRLSATGYRTVGFSTNPWISTDFDYDAGFDEFENIRIPLPFDSTHPRSLFQRFNPKDSRFRKFLQAARWAFEGNPVTRTINTVHYRRYLQSYADADVLNDRVKSWLETNNSERPFFMFLNYMDAHEPYNPLWKYLSEFRDRDCSADISWHLDSLNERYSESEIECINDLYDASLRYLDERIGELYDLLKARGLADETLIVLTADHGKCLGEQDYMGVGTFLYDELVRIPLIVAVPDRLELSPLSMPVSQVDINHLIRDVAGIPTPEVNKDGAYSETVAPHQEGLSSECQLPRKGLRRIDHGGATLVRDVATGETKLKGDPSSTRVDELKQLEQKYVEQLDQAKNQGSTEIDSKVRDHLTELGYL